MFQHTKFYLSFSKLSLGFILKIFLNGFANFSLNILIQYILIKKRVYLFP